MIVTKFFLKFVLTRFSLRVDANWIQFFSIDSLDVTSLKYMFNIFLLLNTAKIEKTLKWNQNLWNILFDILNGPFSRQFNSVFEPIGFLPVKSRILTSQTGRSSPVDKNSAGSKSGRARLLFLYCFTNIFVIFQVFEYFI